jgi:hypothetical protein
MAAPAQPRGVGERAQLQGWLAAVFSEEPGAIDPGAKKLLRALGIFLLTEDFCQSTSVRYSAGEHFCKAFIKLHFPDLAPWPKLKELVARRVPARHGSRTPAARLSRSLLPCCKAASITRHGM